MCILNNITGACSFTAAGVQAVWLLPFGDLYDLRYPNNDLNFISEFQVLSLPVTVACVKSESEYSSTMENNLDDKTHRFVHRLRLSIKEMSAEKREELRKILHLPLHIFFKDMDGRCWAMGYDTPCKVVEHTAGTGGDFNGYNISFTNVHKEQIKQVACFDVDCITSMNGQFIYQSIFTFPIDFTDTSAPIQIAGGGNVYSNFTNSVNPFTWSTPAGKDADTTLINNMLNGDGFVSDLTITNPSGAEELANIIVWSSSQFFDTLSFTSSTPIAAAQTQFFNIQLTLGNIVQNATITVTDTTGSTTLYSGNVNDPVTGTGLSGTVGNAFIDVVSLFPLGATFSASVPAFQNCPSRLVDYVYVPPSPAPCNFSTGYSLAEGQRYTLTFDKLDAPQYRMFTFNFDGALFRMGTDFNGFHSNFSTFVSEFTAEFNNMTVPVNTASLVITDLGAQVRIVFDAFVSTDLCYIVTRGYNSTGSYAKKYSAIKSNLIKITTLSSSGVLTINDSTSTASASGNVGSLPAADTFKSEVIPSINNGQINDFAFDLNGYAELTSFQVLRTNPACPLGNATLSVTNCTAGLSTNLNYHFSEVIISCTPDSGVNFTVISPLGSSAFTLASPLTFGSDFQDLSFELNQLGIRLLTAEYMPFQEQIVLWLRTSAALPLVGFISDNGSTIGSTYESATHSVTPKVHPDQSNSVLVPTPVGPTATHFSTGKMWQPIDLNVVGPVNVLDIDWDGTDADLIPSTTESTTVYFTIGSPDITAPNVSYTVTGTLTANITADLSAIGYGPSDVSHVLVRTASGFECWNDVNLGAPALIKVAYDSFTTSMYGDHESFTVLTNTPSTDVVSSTVSSAVCASFSPLSLNPSLWVSSDEFTPVWSAPLTSTATCTSGSPAVTTSVANAVFSGEEISFDGGTTHYRVSTVTGFAVTLTAPFVGTTGTYPIRVRTIPTWEDKSAFNRTISSVTSAPARIRYDVLDNKPVVRIQQATAFNVSPPPFINFTNCTLYLVFRNITGVSGGLGRIFSQRDGTLVGTQPALAFEVNSAGLTNSAVRDNLLTARNLTGLPVSATDWNMYNFTYRITPSASPVSYFKQSYNGGVINQTLTQFFDVVTSNFTTLFSDYVSASYISGWGGEIAEMILFPELNDSDLRKVEGHFAWKYNLQGNLPATHPYKFFAP